MQSYLLGILFCFFCYATWTAAAPPVAQTTSPPDVLQTATLTSDRLPSPVTELQELASFGIDGTRDVVNAEMILNEALKKEDVEKTLRMANASALRKDPVELISHYKPWKFKAPGSKAVFKIQRVLEQRWTYPRTAHLIDAIYRYYHSTEQPPMMLGRYYRMEFVVHDEDGIHLAFGKVRESHTPWAALVDDGSANANVTAAGDLDGDLDDLDDPDSEPPDLSANSPWGSGGGAIVKATASLTVSLGALQPSVAASTVAVS